MSVKLLFLSYDLPYPPNSGGKIRSFNLLTNLAKKIDVTLYSYYRSDEQLDQIKELKKICSEVKCFKRNNPWEIKNFIRSISTFKPYMTSLYYQSGLEKQLTVDLQINKFNYVHFESFYPALFLPLVKKFGIPVILGNENVEYKVYDRFADQKNFFLKPFFKAEVLRMKKFEESLWRSADLNLAISDYDAVSINQFAKQKSLIIPNGVNTQTFKKHLGSKTGNNLIFIGSLSYKANADAAKYLLEEIFPLIKKSLPKIILTIISWYKPNWLEKYLNDPQFKLNQDRNQHPTDFLVNSDIYLAPMRIASGTNIKILEAMAGQLPVITTSIGIEGIKAGKNDAVVVDGAKEFAEKVVELINSPEKRKLIGQSGYNLVSRFYEWSKITQPLVQYYLKKYV